MFFNKESIEQILISKGIDGKCWGRTAIKIREEIENFLESKLPVDLSYFIEHVGNVIIGPYNIVLSGDENGAYNSLTETADIEGLIDGRIGKALKIMDHAGESYLYIANSQTIAAYETMNIVLNYETLSFSCFSLFIEWVIKEALRRKKSSNE